MAARGKRTENNRNERPEKIGVMDKIKGFYMEDESVELPRGSSGTEIPVCADTDRGTKKKNHYKIKR